MIAEARSSAATTADPFRLLADCLPGLCWLADAHGRVTWMNAPAQRFFGPDAEPLALVHPDDAASLGWPAARTSGTPVAATARLRAPDGQWAWFLHRIDPVRDQSGAIAGWCAIQLDLGDAQRAVSVDAFLRAVGDAVRAEVDEAGIMAVAASMLRVRLDATRVAFVEKDGRSDSLSVRHAALASGGVERLRFVPPSAAVLARWRYGDTTVSDGTTRPSVAATIDVPMIRDGELAALLSVSHDTARAWTAEAVQLVEEVAERAWSAIARVRAEAALTERERAQAFLIGWADAVRQGAGTRAILATTLDQLGQHLRAARLSYAEVDGDAAGLTVLQHWGTGASDVGMTVPFATLGEQLVADHVAGRPLVVADNAVLPLCEGRTLPLYCTPGTQALVAMPLVRDGRLLAVLYVYDAEPRGWTDAEVRLIGDVTERTWAILERARFEERLAQSEALLAAFMEHAPVGMHLKDADGRYLRLNPELATAIGRPADEILGRHPDDLFPPEIAERIAAMEARALGGASVAEEFATDPRDRYASLLSISFPIKGDQAVRTGGFTLDLTDRKAAETALERSREALYQSEKLSALGSMLAGVSHELNNPLSIVVAQAVMMERQAKGTDLAERAFKIRKAADRCARIVQTFLAMARQKKPERTPVDLSAVADAAIELANYGLRSDGVGITRALAADLPRISADSDQLHQVATNLIVNAQQAMAGSRELRWLEVRTSLGPEPRTVIMEVADSGPGIPAELRRRVFEPFYTTKPQGEGTGVGLSFSQGVAEAHGGRLTLVPTERGACFRLTLPFDEGEHLPRVEPAPPARLSAQARRALIVDDEEEIAGSLADFLSLEGFACEVVVGGAAAQRRLAQGDPYDLVVSDLRMPDVDGPALFAWIGEHRPELVERTAFTTGDTLGTAVARFLAGAGRPVLEKPFMPDSIRRFLTEAIPE